MKKHQSNADFYRQALQKHYDEMKDVTINAELFAVKLLGDQAFRQIFRDV